MRSDETPHTIKIEYHIVYPFAGCEDVEEIEIDAEERRMIKMIPPPAPLIVST